MNHTLSSLRLFLFISFVFAQTQLGSDIDSEAGGDYFGRSVSMNSTGDRVAIGAYYNDGTGYRSVIWDATNDYGKPVSAGIYLYQIQTGEYIQTKKMVLLK